MAKRPKVDNIIKSFVRPLNPRLIGASAETVENYYSKIYVSPSDLFLYTMPRFQQRMKQLKLSKAQQDNARTGFAQFSSLGQILFEKKFPQYYHRADKAPPTKQ